MNYKYPFVVLAVYMCTACIGLAQRHHLVSNRIASLQVVANGDWMSLPIMKIGESTLDIDFDDLTHTYHRYVYKIEHCNADWSVSTDVFESDYIEGFADGNTIDDVTESLNTNQLYTHYHLQLPNSRCNIKMSGNYKLTVYDDNTDQIMFEAFFMVVEPIMGVKTEVSTNTDIDINKKHQQVGFEIGYGSLTVTDPVQQIHTVVLQNQRWDNACINAKPQYFMQNGLKWDHNKALIFEAGNEYRKFEILDTNHPTMGIDRIDWDSTNFHAYLFPDMPRPNYVYDEDANGAFYIRNSDNIDNNTQSDYLLVHFQLFSEQPFNGDIYVNGAWTNDSFLPKYKLSYDEVSRSYKAVIPLKQGYYSYQYLLKQPNGEMVPVPTEGSFYQTENTYQVLVYYRELGGRTDRLVGYQQVKLSI